MPTEETAPGPSLVRDSSGSSESPREVRVLAFAPDSRPGEWQARQLALRRLSTGPSAPPRQILPTITPPRPSRAARGAPRGGSLPIPNAGAGVSPSENGIPGRSRKVGVEIAPAGPMRPDRARYFLTLSEQRLQVPERHTIWTIKEAAWKALESDGPTSFTEMELRFDDYGSLREVSLGGRLYPAGALVLSPWPEYLLAVVWIDGNAR